MKKTTVFAALCLVLTAVIWAQQQQDVAAVVLSARGTVEVEQSPWAPVQVDMSLFAGNRIRTGQRSRAALLLADETQMKLGANSELELRAIRPASNLLNRVASATAQDQSIVNMNRGRAWLRSKKQPANVSVNTPAVTAAIRGTEFDIQVAEDGETTATVVEGSINFFNDQGQITVETGEQGRCRVGEAPTKTVLLNPEDAVQWTLFYSASVSARDYPFVYSSQSQAAASIEGARSDAIRLAEMQHDAGRLEESLGTLEGLDSARAAEVRGWIYLEQNRVGEAVSQFDRAGADSPRVRLGRSLAHFRANEMVDAYRWVEDPGDDARLKVQKATLELLMGSVEEARSIVESIPSGDPAYGLGQGLLSNVLLAQNDKDAALQAAQAAVAASPESPSAHLNLSLVQQSFFDLPAATRSAEGALELDPGYLQAQVQYAKLLFGAGNSARAEQVMTEALAVAPEEAAVHSVLGFILLAQGKTEQARVRFEQSVALDNTRGEPHLGLGIAAMRERRLQEAELEMLKATTLEPQMALYQSYLAKAFYEEKKFEQAFTALEAAMELDPRDPTPYLYSGIYQEDLNRPGVAVEDYRESIRLNDNRAVYRSKFVLDEDRATRNVKLATAYNRLGLTEAANLEAVKSHASDPTNSSGRIFLADTFLNLEGRTTAGGSELLMARLLLPVNANSFNSFNDYTTLFERTRLDFTFQPGKVGNLDTYSQSFIASGGARRYAFGAIATQERTDGFRAINDDERAWTGVSLFKFAPTPHSDLMLAFSHTQSDFGDTLGSTVITGRPRSCPDNDPDCRSNVIFGNDPNLRFNTRQNRAEIGYHHQFNPGSELVVYFSGRTFERLEEDPDRAKAFFGQFNVATRILEREPNLSFQASHLLKISDFQLKYGFDIFEGRSRSRTSLRLCAVDDATDCLDEQEFDYSREKVRFKTLFVQGDYVVSPRLIFTAGLNYDWARRYSVDETGDTDVGMDRFGPQAGFLVAPSDDTTFRFSFSQTMQTNPQERLVPTHLFGFVLSPNELERTRSTSFEGGWDQRLFGGRTFLRLIGFWRERTIPTDRSSMDPDDLLEDSDFYGGRAVLNQFLTDSWTLVADYSITRDRFVERHDHDVRLAMFYVDPRGIFLRVEEEFLHQTDLIGRLENVNVWTTNAGVSYELPDKLGLLSFNISNIFDREYEYLADPLALNPRIPRRRFSLDVNFFF